MERPSMIVGAHSNKSGGTEIEVGPSSVLTTKYGCPVWIDVEEAAIVSSSRRGCLGEGGEEKGYVVLDARCDLVDDRVDAHRPVAALVALVPVAIAVAIVGDKPPAVGDSFQRHRSTWVVVEVTPADDGATVVTLAPSVETEAAS
jgi:hypothetical protein